MAEDVRPGAERRDSGNGVFGSLASVLACGGMGAIAGALIGICYCCYRWPDGNLAGLVGIFYGFPIGFAVGILGGLLWRRPRDPGAKSVE
jgi:hypothetical protein